MFHSLHANPQVGTKAYGLTPAGGTKLLISSTPPWKWTVAWYTPFAKIVVVVHLPCKCQWQEKGLNVSWGLEDIFSFVFNRSCNIQDVANVTCNYLLRCSLRGTNNALNLFIFHPHWGRVGATHAGKMFQKTAAKRASLERDDHGRSIAGCVLPEAWWWC